ncbi:UAA transporter family protein [Nitzschia inconspicua]|uniref:UAA transporter family protein n=1 Tax=Nitzschia inconspicua TaxID=303405 RepID=A0A9K3L328_9STRA|nr:UAA transporter family protein [Nitzschia inconspicua]
MASPRHPMPASPSMKMEDERRRESDDEDMKPLMTEMESKTPREIPMGNAPDLGFVGRTISNNPEFFAQAAKFAFCFFGLQASYLTWGYMQELIMTTSFEPTERVPTGKFPSAAFCVFSNRFLAVIVAMIAVKIRHGSIFSNNSAPLWAFTPCALSNTMSSWSQYASLKYVSFPVQTVFKSSKIIPVMMMGKLLKGTSYPIGQYIEALLITVGVAIFSIASKTPKEDNTTNLVGLILLLMYVFFDSFTAQWQDKIYQQYGKKNVDPYQMMLGVNTSAICITTAGLIITGDLPIVWEFLAANPVVLKYNIITAITSASGQLCIFYTIKEFGPIVFTIIMTTRQLISICISSVVFAHPISLKAFCGAALVFSVIFYQIRRKYNSKSQRDGGGGGQG